MRLICSIAVATAVLTGAAAAQGRADSPRYLTSLDLDHARMRSGNAFRFYPKGLKGRVGQALVECRVEKPGPVTDCKVLGEYPAGAEVGKAALRLAALMDAKPHDGAELPAEGAFIVIPLGFREIGATVGENRFLAGGSSYLITRTPIGEPTSKAPCPTAADPNGACYLHPVAWTGGVSFSGAADVLLAVGKTTASSSLNCVLDAAGRPETCEASADLSAEQRSALIGLMKRYQARATTPDGVVTANGRVAIFFDWPELTGAINASALKRPR